MPNQLEQLEAELMSVLTMLQTVPRPVLIASMRINTILAAAAYDEQAAKTNEALVTATAEELGISVETKEEKDGRIKRAIALAQLTKEDSLLTAAQKKGILEEAGRLGLTQAQLEAFDIVTRMIHLDRNIKMAYLKAANIKDQDKLAAGDLEPFWSELSRHCLSKSTINDKKRTELLSLTVGFIEYSDKGTQGQHVLSRLESVLLAQSSQSSPGSPEVQKVMSKLARMELPSDENKQKQACPSDEQA